MPGNNLFSGVSQLMNTDRFVNMFEVASHDKGQHAVEFSKVTGRDGRPHVKGGWQGGRGWQVSPPLPLIFHCLVGLIPRNRQLQ